MKSKKKGLVVFKLYDPYQQMLFPPSFNELIPEGHPVRGFKNNTIGCPKASQQKGASAIKVKTTGSSM